MHQLREDNQSSIFTAAAAEAAAALSTLAISDATASYPFELMKEQRHALEQLQADFRWGAYGIRVIRFHHTSFPPGKIDTFHKHSQEYEFHFIPRGKGVVIMEDTPYALHEGLMYLTAPQVLHYQEADGVEGMDELCLRIQIVRLEETPPSTSGWGAESEWHEAETCIRQLDQIPRRPQPDRFRAMECFLSAYRAWYESQLGLLTTVRQAIIAILLRTVRAYFPEAQQQLPSRDMNRYRYKLAEQFIKDNYQDKLTLEAVAERIHISPRQLQRIIRSEANLTFTALLEQARLSKLCQALVQESTSIEQLAIMHGFSSANYLHRVFKQRFGYTPQQYRNENSTSY